jgi:hypothetical protein
MGYPDAGNCVTAAPRNSAANEVCALAAEVLDFADNLACRMEGKLGCITIPQCPQELCKPQEQRAYPPLFEELRGKLLAMKRCLYAMESTIDLADI